MSGVLISSGPQDKKKWIGYWKQITVKGNMKMGFKNKMCEEKQKIFSKDSNYYEAPWMAHIKLSHFHLHTVCLSRGISPNYISYFPASVYCSLKRMHMSTTWTAAGNKIWF